MKNRWETCKVKLSPSLGETLFGIFVSSEGLRPKQDMCLSSRKWPVWDFFCLLYANSSSPIYIESVAKGMASFVLDLI